MPKILVVTSPFPKEITQEIAKMSGKNEKRFPRVSLLNKKRGFTSSWRRQRFGHVDQWSWYVDHGHGGASDVGDHDGIGSKNTKFGINRQVIFKRGLNDRLTFFMRSRSSRSLDSRPLEMIWEYVQSGTFVCYRSSITFNYFFSSEQNTGNRYLLEKVF